MTSALGFLKKVHFVGIGGIGMSGIAEVLHNMGFLVTGSDQAVNSNVERLLQMGIKVYNGHSGENIIGADVIVYSSAVKNDNPELVKAKDLFIPVIKRGEMLAELMRMNFAIAIAGSHGKTTTTCMISDVLNVGGYDPTTIIGGRLNSTNNNATLGKQNLMVAEADESDKSFLMLFPSIAVVTNIDKEHMDVYKDFQEVKDCFIQFTNRIPFYGCAVVCLDDNNVSDIIPSLEKRFVTYGVKAQADIRGTNIVKNKFSVSFDVERNDVVLGRVTIHQPGDHIVLNGLAAVAVCLEMKVPFSTIADALGKFEGVQRRMSIRYCDENCIVVDDYGHHPTEIIATLKALRDAVPNYKICAVFQPHRYSRTQVLMADFAKCFFDVDHLFITDIYAASEEPIPGIDTMALINEIKNRGFKNVYYLKTWSDIYNYLVEIGYDDTAIVTIGAGSITKLSLELADHIKARRMDNKKSECVVASDTNTKGKKQK